MAVDRAGTTGVAATGAKTFATWSMSPRQVTTPPSCGRSATSRSGSGRRRRRLGLVYSHTELGMFHFESVGLALFVVWIAMLFPWPKLARNAAWSRSSERVLFAFSSTYLPLLRADCGNVPQRGAAMIRCLGTLQVNLAVAVLPRLLTVSPT